MFSLAFIIGSLGPAHAQTPCLATAAAMKEKCQTNSAFADKAQTINLTVNKAKTRFRLQKGVTSYVIPLSAPNQKRCFTLENENVAAKGTFSIATASRRLPVNDANWNVVAGAVRFRQKRQFYLSLVGVEAKFVRLTFEVDGPGKTAQPN